MTVSMNRVRSVVSIAMTIESLALLNDGDSIAMPIESLAMINDGVSIAMNNRVPSIVH